MTSRHRQRAAGVLAGAGVVVALLLIGVLWAAFQGGLFNPDATAKSTAPAEIRKPDVQNVTSAPPKEMKEFVRPIKISPQGLHEDDILYASDQVKGEVPLRHHSGHYRLRTAHVWDPHPVYEFHAFNRPFVLILEHDVAFVPPELHVTHVWENSSKGEMGVRRSHHDCFYHGKVEGDTQSKVVVNLCHGITGHIKTSDGSYLIRPAEHNQSNDHSTPLLHIIYRENSGKPKCGLMDDIVPVRVSQNEENSTEPSHRTKRSLRNRRKYLEDEDDEESLRGKRSVSSEFFVELMVVADRSMAEYHGDFLEIYILSLMYIVSGIFKDASIGNPITISLVKLEILYDRTFARHRSLNGGVIATEVLSEFCAYQSSPLYNEGTSFHHDTALLLTRDNICRNLTENQCDTLGLAELGTVCEPQGSCSIVQDNGLSAAFTMAHELGHVLNMPHDGESYCRQYTNMHSHSHVMSNSHHQGTNPWSWSECSRHIVTEFLESKHGSCLHDRPRNDFLERWALEQVLPGERIEGNRQCELLYGYGSKICSYMPVCRELWCTKTDGEGCQTLHMPWSDGTPCADRFWCQKGQCVARDRGAIKRIDGQWGSWQEFGPCSRTCGGGIKRSHRECDNPRPENGGRYCVGQRNRYKSCETQDCPSDSGDFRHIQCSKFDSNTRGIPGLPSNVQWVPKYGMSQDDRCNLYCRAYNTNSYFSLRDKVIDGTPCSPDSFDICVNGKCMPAGCDHILHSGIHLDVCGKCGGLNDTCKLVSGNFNESARAEGYRTVVRIPAGSSNLDIRQHGNYRHHDDNYLALVHGVTGDGLLNNDYVLTTFRKLISYEGTTLEYSGSTTSVERINASRPLKRDLQVEVLSVGRLSPPDISYQYTVPKFNEDRYTWRHVEEWTDCDNLCNGKRMKQVACFIADTDDVINESYCSFRTRPDPLAVVCNTNCDLSWRVTGTSECSSHCGRGTRTVMKECVQNMHKSRAVYTYDGKFCSHLPNPPPDVEECEGPCDLAHWKYGEWSECSRTCGTGIQHREAFCVDDLDRPKHPDKCEGQPKHIEKKCDMDKCPTFIYGNWSTCSVTCGRGVRTRQHWCQRNQQIVDMSMCGAPSDVEQPCEMSPCTRWSTSTWSSCSVTCGVGYATRKVSCVDSLGYPQSEDDCLHEMKPSVTQECNAWKSCVSYSYKTEDPIERFSDYSSVWSANDWSDCSASCGGGIQTRRVVCKSRICRGEQPIANRVCNELACPNPPQWLTKEWSPCSSSCGTGIQQRQVLCQNHDGQFLQDIACERNSQRPESEMRCQAGPCPIPKPFRWRVGKWTACSETCGTGVKHRTFRCVEERTGEAVADSYCANLQQPKRRQRSCVRMCPFMWQEGAWSQCSEPCGKGRQMRNVTCHQVNSYNWIDPDPLQLSDTSRCDLRSRPNNVQGCQIRSCSASYYWAQERWTQCTQSCGNKGSQKPVFSCRDANGRHVPRNKCQGIEKPPRRRRPCNVRSCMYASCEDIQKHTNARSDGEFRILVGGVNATIYCKDMNTAMPTEYLTLPQSDENFVWFSYITANNECPRDGTPQSHHKSQTFTGFQRVRLDVNRLVIKTDDFSFSNRNRGSMTPFGEVGRGGYCHGRGVCLQGLFKINLRGTPFQVAPTQKWRESAHSSVRVDRPDPQTIRGKCGGECGHCFPSTPHEIKLHVLPP